MAKLNRDSKLKEILREISGLLKTEGDNFLINNAVLDFEVLEQAKHLLDQYLPIYPDSLELNLTLANYQLRVNDATYHNVEASGSAFLLKEIDAFTYTEDSVYHNEPALKQAYEAIEKK